MGTRHLIAVYSGGTHRIAQYGQWDGYPMGQGKAVLTFAREHLSTPAMRAHFQDKLAQVRFVGTDYIKRLYEAEDIDANSRFISMDEAKKFDKKHPALSRDTGAGILDLVLNADGELVVKDSIDFASDSLFCEWAYVIDLDQNVLEVYTGFQKSPVKGRFADLPQGKEYYPIALMVSYSLDTLPSLEGFLQETKREDEE